MPRPAQSETLERLKTLVGPAGFSVDADELAPHLTEWRNRFVGKTPLLLKPASTAEVAAIVRVCAEADVAIVAQGGNTGLVGGQIPRPEGLDLLLSMGRHEQDPAVDAVDNAMVVEAGCTLAVAQEAAADVDGCCRSAWPPKGPAKSAATFPPTRAASTCFATATPATPCWASRSCRDGEIWNGLRALRKDNTGYDLKHLFIGAEGTLGIITAAV